MNTLVVEQLGKCYHLKSKDKSKTKPTKGVSVRNLLSAPRNWFRPAETEEFWALKNATFSVEPGTVLGIIGANGAGKSTLLKILARVTPLTEGRVLGQGRVVSLLEMGAGFDPDVSARENIYMNAAMYGIPHADVLKGFDKIIEFAEIGEFVDHPLKHFSSGMYLRLAFSVSINMHPTILLADEILAVGDMVFQERCMEKVAELAKEGLTVLFVSHDMDAITRVCNRALWLNRGEIVNQGDPEDVVNEYQNASWASAGSQVRGRHTNRIAEVVSARLINKDGKEIGAAPWSEDVFVRVRFLIKKTGVHVRCAFDLYQGNTLLFRSIDAREYAIDETGVGMYEGLARIPKELLGEVNYRVNASIMLRREEKESALTLHNALSFMTYTSETAAVHGLVDKANAALAPRLDWTMQKEPEVVTESESVDVQ